MFIGHIDTIGWKLLRKWAGLQSGYIRNDKASMPRRLVLIIIIIIISFVSVDQQQNFDKEKSSETFY